MLTASRSRWHVPVQVSLLFVHLARILLPVVQVMNFVLIATGYVLGHKHGAPIARENILLLPRAAMLVLCVYFKLHIHDRTLRPCAVVAHGGIGKTWPFLAWIQMHLPVLCIHRSHSGQVIYIILIGGDRQARCGCKLTYIIRTQCEVIRVSLCGSLSHLSLSIRGIISLLMRPVQDFAMYAVTSILDDSLNSGTHSDATRRAALFAGQGRDCSGTHSHSGFSPGQDFLGGSTSTFLMRKDPQEHSSENLTTSGRGSDLATLPAGALLHLMSHVGQLLWG